MRHFIFFTIYNLLAVITSRQINYEGLGSFTDDYPYYHPLYRPCIYPIICDTYNYCLPDKPTDIKVQFYLHTRQSPEFVSLEPVSHENLGINFNPRWPTKIIVHGWQDSVSSTWIMEMIRAFHEIGDFNVISVDWDYASDTYFYCSAAINTQIAGAETARLVQSLIDNTGVRASSFHLIGHSLGAHVCGYAGARVKGLGRITGLDPASPYFEHADPIVRLDKNDAEFVDIIHTAGYKFIKTSQFVGSFLAYLYGDFFSIGFLVPLGHVDFYPNGGELQPECYYQIKPGCSHSVSHELFTKSIRNPSSLFVSYPCRSKEDFDAGYCSQSDCGPNGCNHMGYWASPNNDLNSLYLHTSSDNQVSSNQALNNQASPGLANIVRSSFLVLNTNFLCNRKMNAYLKQELYLGIEYLNASIYMYQDSMAMNGFGKLFENFWHIQLENVNGIRKYVTLRGGVNRVPSYRLRHSNHDQFANITTIIHKFIEAEEKSNIKLLELHKYAMNNEMMTDGSFSFTDPVTVMYLDQNLLGQKVDRIKFLVDLLRDLIRLHQFHRNEDGSMVEIGINQIGVQMIDDDLKKESYRKFL